MQVLIVGGAGYIGSHAARCLRRAGHSVWVYDNLRLGHLEACEAERLITADLLDSAALVQALRDHSIEAVLHFAAFALVGESVNEPDKYYQNNIVGTLRLLGAMRIAGVHRIVFSSSCATYGLPAEVPIREETPQLPVNPYGYTKLVCERMLADYAQAYGIGSIGLRYFNAAGASPDGDLGEDHTPESHLIPLALQVALGQRSHLTIYGADYPTVDGTCVRDYIHVDDLASAHLKALERMEPGQSNFLNLGIGRGFSVKEVVEMCRSVTGHPIPTASGPRRAGDPPELVADASRARRELGWEPQYQDLRPIVETAWNWHRNHPHGYGSRTSKGD